jgi:hypothetical protein
MRANGRSNLSLPPKVRSALEYAVCLSNCWIKEGKVHIDLLDLDVFALFEKFIPVYEQRGMMAEMALRGFDVEPEGCEAIVSQFRNSPKLAKVKGRSLAYNVLNGYPIPEGLRALAGYILSGDGTFPRPKAVKPTQIHRNTLLVGLARRVSVYAEIPLGSSEAILSGAVSNPISGATIAAAALHAFGVNISVRQASKIVYEKGNLVDDSHLFRRIFDVRFSSSVTNAMAGLDPAVAFRKVNISALQQELKSAINWLEPPYGRSANRLRV